jgi:hypothetical protein
MTPFTVAFRIIRYGKMQHCAAARQAVDEEGVWLSFPANS